MTIQCKLRIAVRSKQMKLKTPGDGAFYRVNHRLHGQAMHGWVWSGNTRSCMVGYARVYAGTMPPAHGRLWLPCMVDYACLEWWGHTGAAWSHHTKGAVRS